jgi:hypothetical protein
MNHHARSKYQPLTTHLRGLRGDQVRMSFTEIERVIGAKLPHSADSHRAWWSNNPTNNVMTQAWLDAGFETEQVDLPGRKLVFRRAHGGGPANITVSAPPRDPTSHKPALFGWLRGTIVAKGELAEPADPQWAERIDAEHPSAA